MWQFNTPKTRVGLQSAEKYPILFSSDHPFHHRWTGQALWKEITMFVLYKEGDGYA